MLENKINKYCKTLVYYEFKNVPKRTPVPITNITGHELEAVLAETKKCPTNILTSYLAIVQVKL